MCRPLSRKKCGKTTWAGCGQHVDQALARVPRAASITGFCPAAVVFRRLGVSNGCAFR